MLIFAKKVHPRRAAVCAVLLAAAFGLIGAGVSLARQARDLQASVAVQADAKAIRSNEDRVAYLQQWGWITADEPASVEDILLPERFDSSYDDYLALQKSQGFDLAAFAGKTVKRYTYSVSNYPGLQKNIWASLLV